MQIGWLPRPIWRANSLWSLKNVDAATYQAYRWWADPLRRAMERHHWLRWPVFYGIVRPWAFETAYRAGKHGGPNLIRQAHFHVFLTANRLLGRALDRLQTGSAAEAAMKTR